MAAAIALVADWKRRPFGVRFKSMMSAGTKRIVRLVALAVLFVGLVVVGSRPSVQALFALEHLRTITSDAGVLGMLAFVGLCTGGYLLRVPGIMFVLVALLGWGSIAGSLMSFVGLTVAVSVSFWAFRGVGGSPIADIDSKWVRSILGQLDDHPVRTVALLRVVFFVNPIVNLSLVLTGVRFRDYLVGTVLGVILPLAAMALAGDWLMSFVVAS